MTDRNDAIAKMIEDDQIANPVEPQPPKFTGMPDEELARRACVVLRAAVRDAGRYFARVDFGELNEVMLEAERRGW